MPGLYETNGQFTVADTNETVCGTWLDFLPYRRHTNAHPDATSPDAVVGELLHRRPRQPEPWIADERQ